MYLYAWADWPVIWDGGWGNDYLPGIAVDLDGNIIAAGYNGQPTGVWQFRKYDPNGNLLWYNQYDYGVGGEMLEGVATDFIGNILAGGYHSISGGYECEWLIQKRNVDGTELWTMTYGYGVLDFLYSVASAAGSNYHVAAGFVGENYVGMSPRVLCNAHTHPYHFANKNCN